MLGRQRGDVADSYRGGSSGFRSSIMPRESEASSDDNASHSRTSPSQDESTSSGEGEGDSDSHSGCPPQQHDAESDVEVDDDAVWQNPVLRRNPGLAAKIQSARRNGRRRANGAAAFYSYRKLKVTTAKDDEEFCVPALPPSRARTPKAKVTKAKGRGASDAHKTSSDTPKAVAAGPTTPVVSKPGQQRHSGFATPDPTPERRKLDFSSGKKTAAQTTKRDNERATNSAQKQKKRKLAVKSDGPCTYNTKSLPKMPKLEQDPENAEKIIIDTNKLPETDVAKATKSARKGDGTASENGKNATNDANSKSARKSKAIKGKATKKRKGETTAKRRPARKRRLRELSANAANCTNTSAADNPRERCENHRTS